MNGYYLPVYPTNEEFFLDENALYYLKPKLEQSIDHSDYLYNEFLLQREDFMQPLRNNVKHFRQKKEIMKDLYVYTNPRLEKMKISLNSLNITLTAYVYEAPNSYIFWDRTQRLKSFQLLLISDMNVTKIIQALLVNRENQQPAYDEYRLIEFELRLLDERKDFQTLLDMIDHDDCIIMEPRQYFEGTRHYLNRLKDKIQLGHERRFNLPFHENLLSQQAEVQKPEYLWENQNQIEIFYSFNDSPHPAIVEEPWFEEVKEQEVDPSQMRALHNIFSKRVSLVQGPPGTGKTYCGALAVKTLLHNRKLIGDGPIIVVCQTNHALDQFLNELNEFIPWSQMSRLGSRSKSENIKKIIFQGQQAGRPKFQFSYFRQLMDKIQEEVDKQFPSAVDLSFERFFSVQKQLAIFVVTDYFDVFEINLRPDLVSEKICKKMYDIWINFKLPEFEWIKDICEELQLNPTQIRIIEQFCFALSAQQKFEKFKESIRDPYKYRNINQFAATFSNNYYGDEDEEYDEASEDEDERNYEEFQNRLFQKQAFPNAADFYQVSESILVLRQNIWSIDIYSRHQVLLEASRPSQYNFERLFSMLDEFYLEREQLGKAFDKRDKKFLNEKKVIGMTTTFAARQQRMIQMLDSKIMLIEEAGEILNASNLAVLHRDLEHLILIGDHQQLQPKIMCNSLKYHGFPTISMFERLVKNGVQHVTLEQQRRMKPILSQLVRFIYPIYINHRVAKQRASIRIPQLVDELLFFQHSQEERLDAVSMSYSNEFEARMILEFVQYLHKIGVDPTKITILSFYSQQIFLFRKIIQDTGIFANIKTVDNYQGEENDYIILSTVRSNEHGSIGFLADQNRLCVAFSRAKLGLYVFGNYETIRKWLSNQASHLWRKILDLAEQKEYIQQKIQILCPIHDRVSHNVRALADWANIKTTCRAQCKQILRCGLHECQDMCHQGQCAPCRNGRMMPCGHQSKKLCTLQVNQFNQDDDDEEICHKRCEKTLPCGHKCAALCSNRCRCEDQNCSTILA